MSGQPVTVGREGGGRNLATEEVHRLFRISFVASVLVFLYGTLFPFQLDLSLTAIQEALSKVQLAPYWDFHRGRIQSLPDIVSNILLTIPLGLFGYLADRRRTGWRRLLLPGLLALLLGILVEVVQLAMPSRISSITDLLNNALGALAGAAIGGAVRPRITAFVSLVQRDRDQAVIVLLVLVLVGYTLGPFNFTMSVSDIIDGIKRLVRDPWEVGTSIGHEWVQMVLFGLLGGSVGRALRSRRSCLGLALLPGIALALVLPALLEMSQLCVLSHAPSLRDMSMGTLGMGLGLALGLSRPGWVRPPVGLLPLTAGIVAAGLSPYRLLPWESRGRFEWVPLVEYYERTTTGALYDAAVGLLTFAVWAALFRATFRSSRWVSTFAALGLSSLVESCQIFVSGRTAGMTDILVAALGGWAGHTISRALSREGPAAGDGYGRGNPATRLRRHEPSRPR